MDDSKRAAHELYIKYLGSRSDIAATYSFELEQKISEYREKIRMLIVQFLCTCVPQERFKFQEFPNLILQSSSMGFFEPIKAAEAFSNLESYIALLCIMPWKQEFHQIKKYGGFYQTKIESHLKNADSVFKLIGYSEASSGILLLTHSTKIELLQYVAFECFVASNECHIIENIWNRVLDRGLNVVNVVQIRQQNRGSEEEIVGLIESKFGNSVLKVASENVVDSKTIQGINEKWNAMSGRNSSDPYRNKLENYMEKAKKLSELEDIPFIDEGGVKENEYTPINLDEQILASLQLVEGKDISPSVSNGSSTPGLKPSQEWSFVREGLEKNYGKKYFEGIRKDILEEEPEIRPHLPKEGKYVKVYAENPDPGYINADAARQLRKEPKGVQQNFYNSPMLSESRDSDYATASSAFFPPNIEDGHLQSMRSRGIPVNRQVTDTVLTKGTGPYYQAAGTRYHAKTEPILRRQPLEQNIQSSHHTHPHYRQTGYVIASNADNENSDNIKKYQKRVSAPLVSRDKMDPTQFLPVVSSAPMLTGTRSNSEVTRRNTTDGASLYGAKTANNIQQHNIPVQTNTVLEQTRVNPQWACPHCTFFNSPLTDICEMCSKSRDPRMEMDSPPCAGQSSRICEQCTLENEKNSINCHACGHTLRGTQTVV